jgi:hypothetical protein
MCSFDNFYGKNIFSNLAAWTPSEHRIELEAATDVLMYLASPVIEQGAGDRQKRFQLPPLLTPNKQSIPNHPESPYDIISSTLSYRNPQVQNLTG